MQLQSISLENFRSYKNLKVTFDDSNPITIFVGDNAEGKTNLIEAISLLSLPKSFRTNHQKNVIFSGENYYRIEAKIKNDEDENIAVELGFQVKPEKKRLCMYQNVKKSLHEYIGKIKTIIFTPYDLDIVTSGPEVRRKNLNMVFSQEDTRYFSHLMAYQKALKARNILLKKIYERVATEEELECFSEALIEHGTYIMKKRKEGIKYLEQKIQEIYPKIAGRKESVKLKYLAAGEQNMEENTEENIEQNGDEKQIYRTELKKSFRRDMKIFKTHFGPHRDDMQCMLNGMDIRSYASRGEGRTFVLALKLAEAQWLKDQTKATPIILLDDVFSELDERRQKNLFKNLEGYQVIMTTNHISPLLREHKGIKTYKIEQGEIRSFE